MHGSESAQSNNTPANHVSFDSDAFSVQRDDRMLAAVRWSDVQEIIALPDVDDVAFGVRPNGVSAFVTIAPDYVGFREFAAEIERRFTLTPADWRTAPPAGDWTLLWRADA